MYTFDVYGTGSFKVESTLHECVCCFRKLLQLLSFVESLQFDIKCQKGNGTDLMKKGHHKVREQHCKYPVFSTLFCALLNVFKKFSIYGLKFQQGKQDFVKDSAWTNFFRWNFKVLSSNRLASCSTLSNLKNEQASTNCNEVSIWWCLFLSNKIFHLMYHNHYVWWSCLLTFSKELHFTLQVFAKNSCKVQ